jgi:crotonobetainyl-CoA:carnitine CoA-transferase CaiB-like acyl-CoA transferase
MNTPDEVWEHRQLRARHRWREVGSTAGVLPALLPPATVSGMEPRMDPIPGIGEHTDAVLAGLGYSASEIALLRNDAAI